MARLGIRKQPQSKRAEFFNQIQENMAEIIRGSNIEHKILIKKTGTPAKTFYRKLLEGTYSAKDIIKYTRAIIEIKNEEILKEKSK